MQGTITWSEIEGVGQLVLVWNDGSKDSVEWPDPINASSDSSAIAGAFGFDAADHDGECVFVSKPIEMSTEQLGKLLHKANWEPRRNQKRYLHDLGGDGSADELDEILKIASASAEALAECSRLDDERKSRVRAIDAGKIGQLAEMLAALNVEMQRRSLKVSDVAARCGWAYLQTAEYMEGVKTPAVENLIKLAAAVECRWVLESIQPKD